MFFSFTDFSFCFLVNALSLQFIDVAVEHSSKWLDVGDRTQSSVIMGQTLWELLENSESASMSGIETLCVSDWQVVKSYGSSILLELRILVEFGRDWYVAARKLCSRFLEIDD